MRIEAFCCKTACRITACGSAQLLLLGGRCLDLGLLMVAILNVLYVYFSVCQVAVTSVCADELNTRLWS